MTKTLGIIGAGMIGATLARLGAAAGLDVIISNSRGPETLDGLVAELGPQVRAATPTEAARAGDLVVATVPLHAHRLLPAEALRGKTVIDTMNYYPDRDGHLPELDSAALTSSALVQRHLSGSRVVKACNNIGYGNLRTAARPQGAPDRSALPIAGDDLSANAEAARLLDALGYDVVDTGPLADSWRSEPGTPVYVRPYLPEPPEGLTGSDARRWMFENPGAPVPAARVRELIDAAVRLDAGGQLMRNAGAQ
ncbi:NADPH-dependent F420 reductase [Streptomyces sp. NPDC004539]|uniref:NADPH-dependent F420 reductase n=1 Tax=Streptomyces sp. NPDC004539 TaxID=3154280 RepID=UPI0033BB1EB1